MRATCAARVLPRPRTFLAEVHQAVRRGGGDPNRPGLGLGGEAASSMRARRVMVSGLRGPPLEGGRYLRADRGVQDFWRRRVQSATKPSDIRQHKPAAKAIPYMKIL